MSSIDAPNDPTFRPLRPQPTPPPLSTLHSITPLSIPHVGAAFPHTPSPSPQQLLAEAGLHSTNPQLQQNPTSHSSGGPLDLRSPQPSATTPRHLTTTHLDQGPTRAVPPSSAATPQALSPQPYLQHSLMRSYHDAGSHQQQQQQQPVHQQHHHQQFLEQQQQQQDPVALQDAFASIRTFPLQPSSAPPPQQHHLHHQQQQQHRPQHSQTHPHQHHGDPRALGPPRSMPQEATPQGPLGVRSLFPSGLGGGGGGGADTQIVASPSLQQQVGGGDDGNSRNSSLVGVTPPSRPPARGRNGGSTGITPGATAQITPIKDQNGKFPCPHCSKDYLHAKHLKRHLLRHTGDRPYACVLCNDTFSRSDILKRHFSKCSVRRGNPHGLTHLSHAHAHQRKVKEEKERAATSPSTASSATSPGDSKKTSGKACDQCVKLKVKCDLGHPCERCRSKASDCIYSRNQRRPGSMEDLHAISPHPDYHTQPGLHGTSAGYGEPFYPPPMHPHSHLPQHPNHPGHPLAQKRSHQHIGAIQPPLKRNSNSPSNAAFFDTHAPLPPAVPEEWTGYVQHPFSEPYYNNSEVIPHSISQDPGNGDGMYSMLYQPASSWRFMGQTWPTKPNLIPVDPLQEKCDRLLEFCFPGYTPEDDTHALRSWITPDYLKHFVELYLSNFQNHFPTIHVPTFNIALCHSGLLMAVICTGAVYSDRGIRPDEIRKLMDLSYNAMITRLNEMNSVDGPSRPPEVEDVHAMQLIYVLFTWHGNSQQRQLAKQKYHIVVDLARRAQLFQPLTSREIGAESISYLHQVYPDTQHDTIKKTWNWASWIEQEKRNRCMYTVYLLDTAFVIYFNVPPTIRATDMRLPLPCDDAAWDARDATECANALGLGTEHHPGTSTARQMEFVLALQMLITPGVSLPFCKTNAFSKFIIIHAVNVQIWLYQKHNQDPMAMVLDQWIRPLTKNPTVDPYMQSDAKERMYGNLVCALDTWKKAWDEDFTAQYPDPASRVGFSRDGMPYYWVAMRCIRHPLRSHLGFFEEGNDRNVNITVEMLRQAKAYILEVERNRGEPIQEGAVTRIDQHYGLEQLDYDMKLLFRPRQENEPFQQQQRH